MPSSQHQSYAQRAAALLEDAQRDGEEPGPAAILRQDATILALLAVAEEVNNVREVVGDVAEALKDPEHYGVGGHLRNISGWLERIAEQR